jgi:predicted MPP superfamily phosphohydrolase
LRLGVATLLAAAGGLAYVFAVEPYWIEVTRHSIAGPVTQRLRIAHLSDLHSRSFGLREREILALVKRAAPDVIVMTGDVVDGASLEPARELFRGLRAPLGVWVVRGDSETAPPADQRAFYEAVGARFLDNEGVQVRDDVFIVGFTDAVAARSAPGSPFGAAPAASFKLALFHAPDAFNDVAGMFHLGLAGHMHGGQVRMPGFPWLWHPAGGGRYSQGWYTANRSDLYVSRGLGTGVIGARLFCRPEIALIEIRP